jgi:CDP-glycerol glycerophosphotransferase (TagB/SpsB family)
MSCEKLITSFSNLSNICPFGPAAMRWYADLAQFELVYLQHGILHATLKNMYAKERSVIDKVVVSSGFEVENFVKNYGYSESDLIKSCMPRYDFIEAEGTKKNRIVFSPSWRSNLIGPLVNNNRQEMPEVFVESEFYKQVNAILNSDRLHNLLEENDLYLDFKNHPIFKCYNHLFEVKSNRICLDGFDTNMDEYRLLITDYSSIVFDSVYMNCPVIYFVPDYDKFLAGVSHGYRKLDLPMEEGFGPFTQTADELLDRLEEYIRNGFVPQSPYSERMNGFFLYKDNNCRDRLYDAIR